MCRPYSASPRLHASLTVSTQTGVEGVAQCDNKLFVVCRLSDIIAVFGPNNEQLTSITVKGLKGPTDIVACTETKQLYIADLAWLCVASVVGRWRHQVAAEQVNSNWLPAWVAVSDVTSAAGDIIQQWTVAVWSWWSWTETCFIARHEGSTSCRGNIARNIYCLPLLSHSDKSLKLMTRSRDPCFQRSTTTRPAALLGAGFWRSSVRRWLWQTSRVAAEQSPGTGTSPAGHGKKPVSEKAKTTVLRPTNSSTHRHQQQQLRPWLGKWHETNWHSRRPQQHQQNNTDLRVDELNCKHKNQT